jgi:hypothetical protein
VHRHLPRHVRPTVQEELGSARPPELAHLTQMYSTLHAINKPSRLPSIDHLCMCVPAQSSMGE